MDGDYGFKLIFSYQLAWSISVLVTVILTLTLPFANIVIWKFDAGIISQEIDLDVGVLKCFYRTCQEKQDEAIANEVWYAPYSIKEANEGFTHPRFVWPTKVGSLGTIIFSLFAVVILALQVPSILLNFFPTLNYHQNCKCAPCCFHHAAINLRLMLIGSISILIGLLWYTVLMWSVLNGGSFVYGYWITLMAALLNLIVAWVAYRDKIVRDSIYQPIPAMPYLDCQPSLLDEELLDYQPEPIHLDVYQSLYGTQQSDNYQALSACSTLLDGGEIAG